MKLTLVLALFACVAFAKTPLQPALPSSADPAAEHLHHKLRETKAVVELMAEKGEYTDQLVGVLEGMKSEFETLKGSETNTVEDALGDIAEAEKEKKKLESAYNDAVAAQDKIIAEATKSKASATSGIDGHEAALDTIDALIASIKTNKAFQAIDRPLFNDDALSQVVSLLQASGVSFNTSKAPCYSSQKDRMEQERKTSDVRDSSWDPSRFHKTCDSKGASVTLVRSGDRFAGGFTAASWGGNARYVYDPKAFLFSNAGQDEAFVKFPVKSTSHALYTNPNYGPTFGGGHNLAILRGASSYANQHTGYYTYTGCVLGGSHQCLLGSYNAWDDQPNFAFEVYLLG